MKELTIVVVVACLAVIACAEESSPVDQGGVEPQSHEPGNLTPRLEEGEAEEIEMKTRELLDKARERLRSIDASGLDVEQKQRLDVLQNILREANEALEAEDLPLASTLADKAHVIAGDLPTE